MPIVQKNIKIKFLICLYTLVATSGCGKLSITIEEPTLRHSEKNPPSLPFIGLLSAAGTKISGPFKLEGGIGSQAPVAAQTSGSFKFYGGIQGEGFSR